jgi:iron complex outermembrane receptor protein
MRAESRRLLIGALTTLATFLVSGLVPGSITLAQDRGAVTAQSSELDTDQIQEIVVTAERRATSVQTTAISMTVITADDLAEHQQHTVQDLVTTTPNLVMDSLGPFSADITIRGIGDTPNSAVAGSQPGVATITDGLVWQEVGNGDVAASLV